MRAKKQLNLNLKYFNYQNDILVFSNFRTSINKNGDINVATQMISKTIF